MTFKNPNTSSIPDTLLPVPHTHIMTGLLLYRESSYDLWWSRSTEGQCECDGTPCTVLGKYV